MAGAEGETPTRLTGAVVRGAGFTGVGHLLTQAISLLAYVILARLAGPAVFGAFAAAWIVVGVSMIFAESGMSSALIQRSDRLEEAAATAVIATLAAGVLLTAIALAAAPLVGLYFHSREIGLLAAALSGLLLVNAATVVPDALMRRRFSFARTMVVDPLDALIYGVAGAAALTAGWGAWGLVFAAYVGGVVRVGVVWTLGQWLPDLRRASFAMWRELAGYGRHIVVSGFLQQLSGIANTALIGRFLGIVALGEFRSGWRMATQAVTPVTAASTYVLFPAFARIAHDQVRFRAAFLRSARLLCLLVLPISLALLPLGEQVIVTLLGDSWRTAGHVLSALAGVAAALPLLALAAEVFKAANRPDLLPRISLVLTCGLFLFLVAAIPIGVVGVSGGMSLAFLIAASYSLRQVGRVMDLPIRTLLAPFATPALASFVMAGVLALLTVVSDVEERRTLVQLGWLAIEVIVGTTVYLILVFTFSRSSARELVRAIRNRSLDTRG